MVIKSLCASQISIRLGAEDDLLMAWSLEVLELLLAFARAIEAMPLLVAYWCFFFSLFFMYLWNDLHVVSDGKPHVPISPIVKSM